MAMTLLASTLVEWWMPMLVVVIVVALTIAVVRLECTLCTFLKWFVLSLVQRLERIFIGGKKLGKKGHFGEKNGRKK